MAKSKDLHIQVAAGIVSYFNEITQERVWTFFADITLDDNKVINSESVIDYPSEAEAEKAAESFTARFPIAYALDREAGMKILTEFEMALAPDSPLQVETVKTTPKGMLH